MRAKPYITCGLLAGALTLPVSVFALGLGKLTVQSGLGQPLSATIELTSAQKDELDTLRARIADPAVYRDNNVQYPAAMSRAREQTPSSLEQQRIHVRDESTRCTHIKSHRIDGRLYVARQMPRTGTTHAWRGIR